MAVKPPRRRDAEPPPSRLARLTNATPLANVTAPQSKLRLFIRDTRSELRKVVWPTRKQAQDLTIIVVAVSVAVGAFLGGIDYLFSRLFEIVIGRV